MMFQLPSSLYPLLVCHIDVEPISKATFAHVLLVLGTWEEQLSE
jgi:hypothetical protein